MTISNQRQMIVPVGISLSRWKEKIMRFIFLLGIGLIIVVAGFSSSESQSAAERPPLPEALQRLIAEGKLPASPPGYGSWYEYLAAKALNENRLADPVAAGLIPPKPPEELGFETWEELGEASRAELASSGETSSGQTTLDDGGATGTSEGEQ